MNIGFCMFIVDWNCTLRIYGRAFSTEPHQENIFSTFTYIYIHVCNFLYISAWVFHFVLMNPFMTTLWIYRRAISFDKSIIWHVFQYTCYILHLINLQESSFSWPMPENKQTSVNTYFSSHFTPREFMGAQRQKNHISDEFWCNLIWILGHI